MQNILVAFLAFASIGLSQSDVPKEELKSYSKNPSSQDYKFIGKKEEYRFGVELKENKQFHHTITEEDGVRLGCYGHEQDGKEYLTHYVADGKGYRLVPHQSLITVYPKDGGEPRQASFVDAFGKEEIKTANVKYLFPGGCKSPVIEYEAPALKTISSTASSTAAARNGIRGGKSVNLSAGSDSLTQGDGKLKEVIKEELTQVNRLSNTRRAQDEVTVNRKSAGSVDGNSPVVAPVAAIHHFSKEDETNSEGTSHGSGQGGSNGDFTTGEKFPGGASGSALSGHGTNPKGQANIDGTLSGNVKTSPATGTATGRTGGHATENAAVEGRTLSGNARSGALGGDVAVGINGGSGIRASGGKGNTGNGAPLKVIGYGRSLEGSVSGQGTPITGGSLKGSLNPFGNSQSGLQGEGSVGASGQGNSLNSGANSVTGGKSGEFAGSSYIPPFDDSSSTNGKTKSLLTGARDVLSAPLLNGVTGSSASINSQSKGVVSTQAKSEGALSANARASVTKNGSRSSGDTRASIATTSSLAKSADKTPLRSSGNSQCSDTCCDDDRPQLLLSHASPSSCCKASSKIVIPIDMEKLAKIATSEIIEITAETNTATLLKKLLTLVEKHGL